MKNALIVSQNYNGNVDPAEASPTVLALGSVGSTFPIQAAINAALTGLSAQGTGMSGTQTIQTMTVRVEDSVEVGDTLVKSGDVFHKTPVEG